MIWSLVWVVVIDHVCRRQALLKACGVHIERFAWLKCKKHKIPIPARLKPCLCSGCIEFQATPVYVRQSIYLVGMGILCFLQFCQAT